MRNKKSKYVIGVDGGGTKTEAALADLKGKILKSTKTGPSNLRNIGIEKSAENIALAIKKVLPKGRKVLSIFVGLAAVEEEYKFKKGKIKKEILKKLRNFKGNLAIGSDQLVAFRSGIDGRDGVVLISGTGCVARGWRGRKDVKVSGWGWLNDEGSGFWAGQKGFQAVLEDLDGRGPKTKITKLLFRNWKIRRQENLLKKTYSEDFVHQISLISKVADEAAKKGDKIATSIMKESGKELSESAITVIEKLNLRKKKFPLVLVGKMFKSEACLRILKRDIRKRAPKVKFIFPRQEPVIGAVKLAIENI